MSGLPSDCASQLAAISDVTASRSCTSGFTVSGFERAALQQRQQRRTPHRAAFILQQRAQDVGRRDLAQRLPRGILRDAIVLSRREIAQLRHELALAGLSDGLYRGKTQTGLSVLQRRND